MRRVGKRANAAPEQKGQKIGVLRFASVDVKQLVGVKRLDVGAMEPMGLLSSMNHRHDLASTGENHGQRDGVMRVSDSNR
jgi:hypothetical protein